MTTLQDIQNLARVARERTAQDMKWGEQNHPDGTGDNQSTWRALESPLFHETDSTGVADAARDACNRNHQFGVGTWSDILLEEVAEAFAETEPRSLKEELLQVAAVAVAWVGAIERRTTTRERVYLSGPISGVPDAVTKFSLAAEVLIEQGKTPVNPFMVAPLTHDGRPCAPGYSPGDSVAAHTSSACYMRTDLLALLGCDSIHMLEDWWHSRGANVERDVAIAIGMPITYADGHEPNEVDQ